MKKLALFALAVTLMLMGCKKDNLPTPDEPIGSPFGRALQSIDIVSHVNTIIPVENTNEFTELYEVFFSQPVDHNNPAAGTFEQKAYVFYVDSERPTVLYTCGYNLYERFKKKPFVDLAYNMNANLVMVEHRYFGDSKPANPTDWTYLDMRQAAGDHHAIIQALKPLMPREWVSMGTSKDGMTSVYLRYFYPDDITVTTAFCAPFTPSLTYLPVGQYMLEESGTAEERSQMRNLMGRMFQDGENGLYTRFVEMAKENNLFKPEEHTYTWYVDNCFDYFFNFFSYQTPATRQLPALDMPADEFIKTIFSNLFNNVDYSWAYPYSIQAAKELGRPIEDFDTYADLLEGTAFDANEIFNNSADLKPEDQWIYSTYSNALIEDMLNNFIPNTSCPILFVYAKDDPWTGARPDRINDQCSKLIINPIGVHNHDINSEEHFTPEMKQDIMDFIARFVPYGDDPVVAKRPPYSYSFEMDDRFMIR